MNSDFYSAIMVVCVCTSLIMQVCIFISPNLTQEKKHYFRLLYLLTAAAFFCEYMGEFLNGADPVLRPLHIMFKTVELSISPFICFGIVSILDNRLNTGTLKDLLMIHAFLEFVSAITGFIFYVDAANIYYHSEYYWIYILAYMSSTLYAVFILFTSMKKYQYNGSLFLFFITIFLLFGISIQFILDLNIIWLVITIVGILLYIFNSEMIQQTDALTFLLNRRGYEVALQNIHEVSNVLFFDVDCFKSINDTYGHQFGDHCLKCTGEALSSVYAKYGKCFRIGGDEFCVIMQKDLSRVEELNSEFFGKLTEIREKEPQFPHISLGYVRFDPETQNAQDAIGKADEMMYEYKRKQKNQGAVTE